MFAMKSDFSLFCKMSKIEYCWDIKQDVKDLIKRKTEKYCEDKYKNNIPGNSTFKKIILENLKLKLYINVFDKIDIALFNGIIPACIGDTNEEKMKNIEKQIDDFIMRSGL